MPRTFSYHLDVSFEMYPGCADARDRDLWVLDPEHGVVELRVSGDTQPPSQCEDSSRTL